MSATMPAQPPSLVEAQPPPQPSTARAIWPLVIERAEARRDMRREWVAPLVIVDMRARDLQGQAKYGVPLTAGNGRDFLVDAYQEGLDQVVYLRGHCEEHPDDREAWRLYEGAMDTLFAIRLLIAERRGEG